MDGVRVWLPCACPSAGAIRREYATTLGELLMHRHGLVGDLLINYVSRKGGRSDRTRYEPQRRFGPMRDKASFSTISSPMDDSWHYVYLHASLCAAESSDAVSGIDIATSRELAQSR